MSRAKHLFNRFGTLQERLHDDTRAVQRVNRAADFMNENHQEEKEENVNEQDDVEDLNLIERVQGVGAPEGYGNTPTYAEHGPDYVKFAALTQEGIPFVAVMPRITITQGLAWINRRMKGFKSNPKSRESVKEAIRRKALAAMGHDFVDAMRLKAGEMANAEMDMMFSDKAHSGIGDLDMLSKKPNVVKITINREGDVNGISTGIIRDNEGGIYMTQDMVGRI